MSRLPGRHDRGCGSRVEEPTAGRRTSARARPLDAGCRGAVQVRWSSGERVRAGETLRLEGRWLPSSRALGVAGGLLVARRSERLGFAPGLLDRLRNWLFVQSRSLYGTRAAVVDALILGRRGGIDPSLTNAFARAGLVHILAISGFHVGIVGGWALLLLRLAGVSRARARLAAATLVSCYVGFIGFPAPAVRAAALAWVVTIETERQRRPSAASVLGVTGIAMLLLDPFAVTGVGAWLSVTALAGVGAATRWSDKALSRAGPVRILSGSVGATLGTAPVAALALGMIAPVGVLANLAAIPLAGLAVPGVLASLLLGGLGPAVGGPLAAGSGVVLASLEALAALAAQAPGGALLFEPGLLPAGIALGVLLLAAGLLRDRPTRAEAGRRLAWLSGLALSGSLVLGWWRAADAGTRLTLHFLSVGQGDAALVETSGHHWVLIDAGPRDQRSDAGRRVVLPFLVRRGVSSLDAVLLSHAHLDHFGGAPALLGRVRARVVLEPGRPSPDPAYRALLDQLDLADVPWSVVRAGQRFTVDGVTFEALHPDTSWSGWGDDLNEDSLVLRIRAGKFTALFMGDAGEPVEALLAGRAGRVDLLKVGHHGSATATTDRWLAELDPSIAVVSTGPNRYGHPSPEALARLAASGADVWRTDLDGTVTVMVDDAAVRVKGRRRARGYPLH
ncbi:MAG: DNA internalization-related competence protein ComEC/Rec2 [Gemmatimonadales bacterium]